MGSGLEQTLHFFRRERDRFAECINAGREAALCNDR